MSKFQKVCLVRVTQQEGSSARIYESFPIVVGRSTDTNVGIIDPGVSRLHLEINYKHGRLSVKDLGSANGTYLAGQKIEPNVVTAVDPGVLLELGTNRIPIVIEVLEKSFDVKQIPKSDLTSDQKSKATNMLDAAHAEVQRLSWLFKAQQEQADRASEDKAQKTVKDAQEKANEIVSQAQAEADRVKNEGQKAHDEVVGRADSDAKLQAESVLQNATIQAGEKAKMILEVAEQEITALKEQSRLESERAAAEILNTSDKRAEAQMRLAEMQGQEEARQVLEAAKLEADELRREAARLHTEAEVAYKIEVERGEKAASELRHITEEEISARNERSQMLLKNAVEKSTKMLADAEKNSAEQISTAEMKSDAMMKMARQESESLLEKTQQDILGQYAKNEEAMKQLRVDTKADLKDITTKATESRKELIDIEEALKEIKNDLVKKENRYKQVEQGLEEKTQMATALSENFRIAEAQLKAAQAKLEESTREMYETQRKKADVLMDINSRQAEWDRAKKQLEIEITAMQDKAKTDIEDYRTRSKSEIDKNKLQEFEHLKEIRLEEDRGIDRHRSEIVKELLKSAEMHFLNNLKGNLPADFDWAKVSEPLHGEVRMNLEELVYQLSHKEAAKEEVAGMLKNQVRLKGRLKRGAMITAGVVAVLMVLPWTRTPILEYFGQNSMHAASDQYTKDMQDERARRYSPEKTRVWKGSYTDAILYTEGYVDMKLDSKSQDKWIKELHSYLYGKLRVDEDSIVKIVSLEAALVTNLKQEADQIHPDYVNEKVTRMKDVEAASVAEIKKLIGDAKKFEKFQKFSQDYYYNEYLLRLPASPVPGE